MNDPSDDRHPRIRMAILAPPANVDVEALVERLATRIAPLCRGLPAAEFAKLVHMLVELDLCVRGFRELQGLVQNRVEARLKAA